MNDRALIGLAVAGVIVFGWLLLAPPQCSEPAQPPDAAVVDAAPPPDAAVVDAAPPDVFRIDDETVTVEQLKRYGMLERPAEHLDALFEGNPFWHRDDKAPATWVNENDVRLSFKVRGGKVQSVGAEFPEKALSADLTALSEFMVGQHDALPLRMELVEPDDPMLTEGAFEDRYGRRLYYRAKMRREGEGPYGPIEFEIARTPWPGQPEALTPIELLPGYDGVDFNAPAPPPVFHDPEPVDDSQFDPSQKL